jgi:hypothetical protein
VQAVVEIETDGGTLTARCEHPRGSAENPLSRAQIDSKFRTYGGGRADAVPPSRDDRGRQRSGKSGLRCESSWKMLRAAPRARDALRAGSPSRDC